MSSRQALCSLLILAELTLKKIGPHGETGLTIGGGGILTVTVVEQLPPGHGVLQRVRSVVTFTETVTEPETPVVSRVTSDPLVDDSVPPVVDQVKDMLPSPRAVALSETLSPAVAELGEAIMSHETDGHGGSLTVNEVVQVVVPVVTHSLGQSTAGTDAVTVVVTV